MKTKANSCVLCHEPLPADQKVICKKCGPILFPLMDILEHMDGGWTDENEIELVERIFTMLCMLDNEEQP